MSSQQIEDDEDTLELGKVLEEMPPLPQVKSEPSPASPKPFPQPQPTLATYVCLVLSVMHSPLLSGNPRP